jgi:hypothetical protein
MLNSTNQSLAAAVTVHVTAAILLSGRKLKNLGRALHFLAEVFSFPHCTKMGRLGLRSCRPLCQFPQTEKEVVAINNQRVFSGRNQYTGGH